MYHDYIERIREIVDYNSKPKSAIFRMPLLFKRRFDAKKEQRKATIKKRTKKSTMKKEQDLEWSSNRTSKNKRQRYFDDI